MALILMSLFVAPVMADKPGWVGKSKPTEEQKAAHEAAMDAKEDIDDAQDKLIGKKGKSSELNGLERQAAKKTEQTQNELDKGSDKGKESREANSKKWWKFWGE